MIRRIIAGVFAVALVAGLGVAVDVVRAPAASASEDWPFPDEWTGPAREADLPPKTPKTKSGGTYKFDASKTKWRGFMINVTSSMLGAATPKSWQAEQIANNYAKKGMPSGDVLNSQYGYTSVRQDPVTGKLTATAPRGSGTYDDIVINEYEKQNAGKSDRKKQKVPATKASTFGKLAAGAGGLLLAPFAYEFGTQLSVGSGAPDAVGAFFGISDANGAVCMARGDNLASDVLVNLSGQDCSAWDFAPGYLGNQDAPGTYTLTYGPYSLGLLGQPIWNASVGSTSGCWYSTAPVGGQVYGTETGITLWFRNAAGVYAPGGLSQVGPSSTGNARCTAKGITGWNSWSGHEAGIDAASIQFRKDGVVVAAAIHEAGDPDRSLSCVVTFTDGTSATSTGDTYKESGQAGAPPACPETPPGKVPANVAVLENVDGVPGQTLYDEDTTEAFQDWAENNPECSTGVCLLDLLVEGADDIYVSCFDLIDGCDGWWEDESKEDSYLCRYGTQKVSLAECAVYAGIFAPGRADAGSPYADPATGVWSGGQSSPAANNSAMTATLTDPASLTRSCEGTAVTGFDPVGFVMRPVQCALEWAFVPRPAVLPVTLAGTAEAWEGKPPAAIATVASTLTTPAGAGTGCSVPIELFGVSADIVNVCDGPMAALPIFSRLITSAFMVVMVFNLVRRQIAGMVGYNLGQG